MTTPTNNPAATGILTIVCPDRTGIVAAVSGFLAEHNGNIVDAQQHTDPLPNVLFMRIEFDPSAMDLPREEIGQALAPIGDRFAMRIGLRFTDEPCAMGIMVSREEHCMMDLLMRQRIGELAVRIPVIIGNHPHLAHLGEAFDVPFHVVPVTDANRSEAEATAIQILHDAGCHFVVLARYMQILSPLFLDAFPMAIINIHHGFLPAFAGARPYHQAAERGVKLIGATSHYATATLDDGPIIDQDVIRVSHRDSVEDLIRKGRDVERMVLARAVRAHAEDRVIVYGNRTVVFD
ncbi:MAG: formyltetrahydrofolate deformylase [Chloroflexi bacterium]|nr:formyltetrahydrofolate deformylase [Chloroflexota bacterium]